MNSRVAVILLSCTASCYGGILRANMVSLPNGAVVPSSAGQVALPNGAVVPATGHVALPNGAVVPSTAGMTSLPNGAVVPASGHIALPNGAVVPSSAGMASLPNGAVVPASGHVALPNGAMVPSGASAATYNSGASISTYSATAQAPNLVTLANGAIVPSDNSDVKAAKLAHAQAGGAIEPASGASYVASMAYSGALAGTPSLVTLANGAIVPSDSAEVKAAKLAHAQAGGAIKPATGSASGISYAAGPSSAAGASSMSYSGPLAGTPTLVTLANGAVVPSDSAEVKAAKLAHAQAGGAVKPATGSAAGFSYSAPAAAASSMPYSGPLAGTLTLVTLANGAVVPSDSAEVKAAKVAHAQAGGAIKPATGSGAGISYSAPAAAASSMAYSGPLAGTPTLVTLSNGAVVPSDSAEVKAAKLAHAQAGGAIKPATGSAAGISYNAGSSFSTGSSSMAYSGPLAGTPTLVTLANGAIVPSDSADIKAAKLAHSQAGGAVEPATGTSSGIIASSPIVTYAAAPVVISGLVSHPNGALVPADNADVKAAKIAHAQAGGVVHSVGVQGVAHSGLVAHPNGALVPIEPADVVANRAKHLKAHGRF